MVSYNTCSYPGCYRRIPYKIGEHPEKYCEEHNGRNRSNMISQPTITFEDEPEAIFICRKCKARKTLSKESWLAGNKPELCCGRDMVYHGEIVKTVEITEKR